jgi:hypothetical protein
LKVESKIGFLGRLKKKEYNNFQNYNILSAYEVKDETSTSRTYVSLVFYHTVISRKILVKKELQVLYSEGGSFERFCTKIPLGVKSKILEVQHPNVVPPLMFQITYFT